MSKYVMYSLRSIAVIVLVSLVLLLILLEHSTALVWTVVVPIVPALFLILGYSNWRNICPLAFFAKLSQNLTWIKKRKVPKWFELNFYYFQYSLLFLAFTARLVILNFDNLYLASFFIFLVIAAFAINLVYTGKSWCNFFCPVAVVEKIYCGSNAHNYETNSACSKCSACKKNCPDIDMESNYWKESLNNQKTFVFYSFSGLVLGFYLYFYLQSGTFSHYFSGDWANENVSMLSSGFFFAPFIPVILAAPLTLALFTMGSFYLFKSIENFLWKRQILKDVTQATLIHRVKVSAAFVAFNIFYLFAGAPTYNDYPLAYGLFHFLIITLSAMYLHKEFFREESYFIQERFALKMIKKWNSDKPIPTNLKEIYYTYANEKKNKIEKLNMFKESLNDLMQEGILTEGNIVILEKLRQQMGISKKDYDNTINSIKLSNKDLFDSDIEKSPERRYQKELYKKMLEETLNANIETESVVLRALQEQFQISHEDHVEIMNSNKKLENNVIAILEDMHSLSTMHSSYLDDSSIETNFLKFSLRDRFNSLSNELFKILKIMYEKNQEELKKIKEILTYDKDELLIQFDQTMIGFMNETIVSEIMKLVTAIDTSKKHTEGSYNVGLLKNIMQNKWLELSAVALLNLKKYENSLYEGISYDKFISSEDQDIVDVYKKIVLLHDDIILYDKMMYLHSIPFFAKITFDELHYLADSTILVHFNHNEVIIKQDDLGDSLFILVDGEVDVKVDSKVVARLPKGNYFGEIAIIADVKRTATVIAAMDVITLKLSTKHFKEFILEQPQVSITLMKEMTLRLLKNKSD